jgi:hypothetical protein
MDCHTNEGQHKAALVAVPRVKADFHAMGTDPVNSVAVLQPKGHIAGLSKRQSVNYPQL